MDAHILFMGLCFAFSLKKCCLFLLLIITLVIFSSGIVTLIVVFVLKPHKPLFSLQKLNIVSYKLNAVSESTLFVSSVASMTLFAQNPNKVGIKYGHSRLRVLNDGLVIGMIRIPGFCQPARSNNVSVEIDIFFQCLDISRIISGADTNNFTIQLTGDIGVRLQLFQITLPKIKVVLDCDVAFDGRYLTSTNDFSSMKAAKNHLAHFGVNSHAFSKKCSISFCL